MPYQARAMPVTCHAVAHTAGGHLGIQNTHTRVVTLASFTCSHLRHSLVHTCVVRLTCSHSRRQTHLFGTRWC